MSEGISIDDELTNLGIRDDYGDGDSDITPTNSPPISLSPPTAVKYPVQFQSSDLFNEQFINYEDYDLRTNSSLSWGEDEFEGEATKIVNSLFQQLDQIIYEDDILIKSIHIPITVHLINKTKQKPKRKKSETRRTLQRRYKSKSYNDLSAEQESSSLNDNLSSSEQSLYDDLQRESFSAKPIPQPSVALISECKDWVENFPHLRVNGIGVDIKRVNAIEKIVFAEESPERTKNVKQEVLEQHGDYEKKLQYVTLKLEPKKETSKKPKGPPSRICSGSTDPEVLKEQLLIKLFDFLWPLVSKVVDPLLTQYANHVINQSVQYSSLSREPSSRGSREMPMRPILVGAQSPRRGPETIPPIGWRANRPLSASSRPSSTKYRLRDEKVNRDDLQSFLQIKPLVIHDDRPTPRALSASKISSRSHSSVVSLPTLSNHRPVSSKSNSHLLTPRLTAEQRPTSTSSYTRLRFNDKFQNLNRNWTIEEDIASNYDNAKQVSVDADSLSPTWSRHNSFLPPIPDVATLVKDKATGRQPSPYSSSNRQPLSVRGKSLSATYRTIRSEGHTKQVAKHAPQAEPFVSWIVSKVDEHSSTTVKQNNKINNNNVPIDRTRYYRRASHH